MALFLLERAQIGRGGASGPPGLVEAVAAKAAQGMKVILIQGKSVSAEIRQGDDVVVGGDDNRSSLLEPFFSP